jgi:DMSO/TMAO reductase YedYZ molybdopterin-dependent catalytic subunit
MKTSGKAQWSYRFLPILLALFLVAGVVGLGLLVYTAAYAEDTNTPLAAGVRESETVTQTVYQELNEWESAAGNHSEPLTATATVETAGPVVLEIEGEGVDNLLQFTMADLENMEQCRQLYSTINSWPTKKWYVAEGVKVRDLLDMAGINDEATLIKFLAGDGYNAAFRVEEIYGAQYLFPNFKEGGGDADGHIPGNPSGAIEVEPILALRSANSDNFDHMNTSNALHLIIGQRVVTEQTNEKFVKSVAKIEVLTDPVPKWEEPQASLPSGTVVPGTKIELSTSDMNGDKIYYTTDGSIPTIESTMYNPIAKRWWSSRGAEAVAEINRPIEITEDTTIKAIAIGLGKEDSDLVEFTYTVADSPSIDILYEGTVTLSPGETFTVTAYNSEAEYTVSVTTPLGALQAAAVAGNFTYDVTDKNYGTSGALLLDNVGSYTRKNPGYWYAYVNDVYKDGFNNPDGALNLIELFEGDRVEFYYAAGIDDPSDLTAVKAAAIAAVKTVISTGGTIPTDWTLQLSGAKNISVTKAYFEEALSCRPSHRVSWTDEEGNVWGGMPLWLLVAMVDDDPDEGPDHFNFNDELAAQHYVVDLISGDGWKTTLDSADIARNNGYIVANTLNGEPLPLQTPSGKPCWPLHLKGPAVFGGQQVGNIVRIELSKLPEPDEGWTLELLGDVGDTISQEEFEEGLACTGSGHYREWTDGDGNVWSGVPLWVLLGAVDDIETGSHWTFNDSVAAAGYTVKVIAGDGYSKTFASTEVARSDAYIIANKCNGEPLAGSLWPLRLVGDGVAKEGGSLGGSAVGSIVRIEIPELRTPEAAPGSWNLKLTGKISDVISQAEFEEALACPNSGHLKEWTDKDGNVWSGIPLWLLAGWVDDRQPHAFNANQATAGYTILVKAGDGYTKDFASADVAWSNDYIVANKCNGAPLTGNSAPLRLVGKGVAREDGSLSGTSVGNIAEIELTSFGTVQPLPSVRIVKYAEDGTTILNEITVDYLWMEKESGFDVIGDGTTVYKFEGLTMNPDDLWDPDETYPGGFKIANAVKGTRIRDLCGLVGHMGAGTEIVFVAKDGFETKLPYSSIYPDPSVLARQGEAILAWWADGKYVPDYRTVCVCSLLPGVTMSTVSGICTRRCRKSTGTTIIATASCILPVPAYQPSGLRRSGYIPYPRAIGR